MGNDESAVDALRRLPDDAAGDEIGAALRSSAEARRRDLDQRVARGGDRQGAVFEASAAEQRKAVGEGGHTGTLLRAVASWSAGREGVARELVREYLRTRGERRS